MENLENTIFQIILYGGNGRSAAMEAIMAAKAGNFDEAKNKLDEAAQSLSEAHKLQTSLIQAETRGENAPVSLLMVHAQDHLMNAMTLKDIAVEFIDMYKVLKMQSIQS